MVDPVALEDSGVEPIVAASLDQQVGSLRGPLAVKVPPGHPPPPMVPGVSGLGWWCCCCPAPGISPQGLLPKGGVPGYQVCGPREGVGAFRPRFGPYLRRGVTEYRQLGDKCVNI